MSNKPLAIFDLDGTLISKNTFNMLLKYSIFNSFKEANIFLILRIFIDSGLRLSKLISREKFKQHIYHLTFSIANKNSFHQYCMNYLNQEVMSKFQQLKKTHTTIISSAALPYAQELGKIIGANKIFTSEEIEGKWVENSSQNKADKLVLEFQDQSKFDYFFTDHREDLPLAKLCQKVYIVRPTQKSLDEFKTSLENFTLLE